jgi:hypothetical protein
MFTGGGHPRWTPCWLNNWRSLARGICVLLSTTVARCPPCLVTLCWTDHIIWLYVFGPVRFLHTIGPSIGPTCSRRTKVGWPKPSLPNCRIFSAAGRAARGPWLEWWHQLKHSSSKLVVRGSIFTSTSSQLPQACWEWGLSATSRDPTPPRGFPAGQMCFLDIKVCVARRLPSRFPTPREGAALVVSRVAT